MKNNVCTVYVTRNKSKERGQGIYTLKKKLIKKNGTICEKCNEEFRVSSLQLDHKIPLSFGGQSFLDTNHQILCKKCHRHKTEKDLLILRVLKKMGMVNGQRGVFYFLLPVEEIIEFYKICLDKMERAKDNYEKWDLGLIKNEIYNTTKTKEGEDAE